MAKIVTGEELKELLANTELPVLVDFYADWCGPCQMMAPAVEELAGTYDGKAVVCKINVDQNMDIAREYKVFNIPAFVAFRNGEVSGRVTGAVDIEELEELIK